MNWLKQIGMSKFDVQSSSDPTPDGMATISRRGNRPKSMHGNKMGDVFKKKKIRTATGWFKEVPPDGTAASTFFLHFLSLFLSRALPPCNYLAFSQSLSLSLSFSWLRAISHAF